MSGSGIVAGALNTSAPDSLFEKIVFGDLSGKIWTIDFNFSADSFENRTEDFTPDVGTIDQVVKIIVDDSFLLYILDADGELFRLDAS